jgi:hypothetical protein
VPNGIIITASSGQFHSSHYPGSGDTNHKITISTFFINPCPSRAPEQAAPVGKRLSHLVSLKTTYLIQKLVSGKEFPGLIRGSSLGQPLIAQFVQLPSLQHFSLVRNPGMGKEEML